MEKILSQEEIDSLLVGINDGKIETETDLSERDKELKTYDFRRKHITSHLRMPALRIITERLARLLGASFTAASRTAINVKLSSMEATRFDDFSRSITVPTSLNIFRMESLRGYALLTLDSVLIFSFIETLFGGKVEKVEKVEGRTFTPIERKIIARIVDIILKDLQEAWSGLHQGRMVLVRSEHEMDPQFAADFMTQKEHVIMARFSVAFEAISGMMILCIPHSTLAPIKEKLKQRFVEERIKADPEWMEYITKRVKELRVHIRCTLGTTEITGRELLHMQVGDVILLDQGVHDHIIASVENIPKFKGYSGTSNKDNRAIRIIECIRSQ